MLPAIATDDFPSLSLIGFNDNTGQGLVINDNDALETISGFLALEEITGNSQIFDNGELTTIDGLTSLRQINGTRLLPSARACRARGEPRL